MCAAPGTDRRLVGPFRQMVPVPFFSRLRPAAGVIIIYIYCGKSSFVILGARRTQPASPFGQDFRCAQNDRSSQHGFPQQKAIYAMATISEALAIAIQHHQAGRLQAAEQIYRQILQVEPNHADAIHLLGVIAHQVGKHEIAVEYIGRAIGLNGNAAAFHNNLGEAVSCLGQGFPKRSPATAGHWN